jgi:proteasome lid subunit RPN8/RPN11|tara:strand:+ start:697 stop:1269 length:573 start_codon:yes stop_codon:yes gene_type:complete
MNQPPVDISREILVEIYRLARLGFPNEVCGWLRGDSKKKIVTEIRPAANVYNSNNHPFPTESSSKWKDKAYWIINAVLSFIPILKYSPSTARTSETAYVISSKDLLEMNDQMEEINPPLVIYHSHPNGKAYFSKTDKVVATDPWNEGPSYPVQQLVVGIDSKIVQESRLYSWDEKEKEFIEVRYYKGGNF